MTPDATGHFGPYGGRFVTEMLMEPLRELEEAYAAARDDPAFAAELAAVLRDFVGRPTPLTHAARLSADLGCSVWLKREDLCHTGAHKINNAVGQALLARRMGKKRVIAETGAGQHGVATATVCALFGLECVVYMGTDDMARQAPNVHRMKLLGAEVEGVDAGTRTLKDAINEAMRDWVTHVRTTHYLLGSVLGAHPYPMMVRDFQAVIGREARTQWTERAGGLPDLMVAAWAEAPTRSASFTTFSPIPWPSWASKRADAPASRRARGAVSRGRRRRRGRRAPRHTNLPVAGRGGKRAARRTPSRRASTIRRSAPSTHSLRDQGRVRYVSATDEEALDAFHLLAEREGIIPALESSHALAWVVKNAPSLRGRRVLVNLSGRGDKDLGVVGQ